MKRTLSQLSEEIDSFYLRFIRDVVSDARASEHERELRSITREFDRVVGYKRGFKEGTASLEIPVDEPTLVQDARKALSDRLDALAAACRSDWRGRQRKSHVSEADRVIALRALELQSSAGGTRRSARAAILQAMKEYNGVPLSLTTTEEGHLRRIRRVIKSGLLSEH